MKTISMCKNCQHCVHAVPKLVRHYTYDNRTVSYYTYVCDENGMGKMEGASQLICEHWELNKNLKE